MNFATKCSRVLAASAVALGLAASGAIAKGYVGDLGTDMAPVSVGGFDEAFAVNGTLPAGFDSIYIAPVGIIEGEDDALDDLSENDRAEMQAFLYAALVEAFGTDAALAEAPGAGVLVIEASFTALSPNRPTLDQQGGGRGKDLDYMRSASIGYAGIQVDVRDGANGAPIAAFADYDEDSFGLVDGQVYLTWTSAERFSERWAKQLAEALN